MKKIGVQFFASHNELLTLIREISEAFDTNFCIVSQIPFDATICLLTNTTTNDIFDKFEKIRDCFVFCSQKPFNINFQSYSDFRDKNNCHLSFLVGKQTQHSLQESWFSFMGEEIDEYELAKKYWQKLKK